MKEKLKFEDFVDIYNDDIIRQCYEEYPEEFLTDDLDQFKDNPIFEEMCEAMYDEYINDPAL